MCNLRIKLDPGKRLPPPSPHSSSRPVSPIIAALRAPHDNQRGSATKCSRQRNPHRHDYTYVLYGQLPATHLRQHLVAAELPDQEFEDYLADRRTRAHRHKEVA